MPLSSSSACVRIAHKLAMFADDISMFLRDKGDLDKVFEMVNQFSVFFWIGN